MSLRRTRYRRDRVDPHLQNLPALLVGNPQDGAVKVEEQRECGEHHGDGEEEEEQPRLDHPDLIVDRAYERGARGDVGGREHRGEYSEPLSRDDARHATLAQPRVITHRMHDVNVTLAADQHDAQQVTANEKYKCFLRGCSQIILGYFWGSVTQPLGV